MPVKEADHESTQCQRPQKHLCDVLQSCPYRASNLSRSCVLTTNIARSQGHSFKDGCTKLILCFLHKSLVERSALFAQVKYHKIIYLFISHVHIAISTRYFCDSSHLQHDSIIIRFLALCIVLTGKFECNFECIFVVNPLLLRIRYRHVYIFFHYIDSTFNFLYEFKNWRI